MLAACLLLPVLPISTLEADAAYTEVILFEYDSAGYFYDGLAAGGKDGKWGFISVSGVTAPAQPEGKTAKPTNDDLTVNGVKMAPTVYKIDGSNFFMLRDLGKALDFYVGWTAERGVFIETDKPYSE